MSWTTYSECHCVFKSLVSAHSASTSVSRSLAPDKRRILSQNEKFRKMSTLTQQLASLSSVQRGMAEFNSRMTILQQLLTMWQAGSTAAFVEVVNGDVTEDNVIDVVDMPGATAFIPEPTEPVCKPTEPVCEPAEPGCEPAEPMPELTGTMSEPPAPALGSASVTSMASTDTPFLADVSFPLSVRKRGRPRGKTNTAIGLPIKRRKIDRPVPFIRKPYSDRDLQ